MAKATSGFITSDGVFFSHERDANLYEAGQRLEDKFKASMFSQIPFPTFIDIITSLQPETIAYLEALGNVQNLQQDEDAEKSES